METRYSFFEMSNELQMFTWTLCVKELRSPDDVFSGSASLFLCVSICAKIVEGRIASRSLVCHLNGTFQFSACWPDCRRKAVSLDVIFSFARVAAACKILAGEEGRKWAFLRYCELLRNCGAAVCCIDNIAQSCWLLAHTYHVTSPCLSQQQRTNSGKL
jgi:hypothetical protein